jgi:hypothetical protein
MSDDDPLVVPAAGEQVRRTPYCGQAVETRRRSTWLLDPCVRLTEFGKAIGKG